MNLYDLFQEALAALTADKARSFFTTFGIVIVILVAVGFSVLFFNTTKKITTYEECVKAGWLVRSRGHYDGLPLFPNKYECILWSGKSFEKYEGEQEVQKEKELKIEAIKEFRLKLGSSRIICKSIPLEYEFINYTTPANFSFGREPTPEEQEAQPTLVIAEPMEKRLVAVFRDKGSCLGQVSEYQVDIETNEVVSMKPVSVPVGSLLEEQSRAWSKMRAAWQKLSPMPDEDLKLTVERSLRRILGETRFSKIEIGFDFRYDSRDDNGNYFLRWQSNNYTPPKGCVSLMQPFIQMGITKSGRFFSYENNTGFFEDLQSNCKTPQVELTRPEKRAELLENCARDIPREKIDDTSLNQFDKIVTVWWWDNELQDNIALKFPYEPETGFAGCSESVKALLLHIQETYEDR